MSHRAADRWACLGGGAAGGGRHQVVEVTHRALHRDAVEVGVADV